MASQQLSGSANGRGISSSSSRVLRLRGMPFAAADEDVRNFFAEFSLEEVYVCKRDGRSTGEAYVVLETPVQAEQALAQLNKKYMGSRYIELFEAAEADLAAVKKVLEDSRLQGFVVRLRGLPYTATAADIIQFFQGVQLAESDDAIILTMSVDGRPTGEAYVELANEAAQAAAMTKHKDLMGTRYIEIFHSSKMDKLQAAQQRMLMPDVSHSSRWSVRGSWAEANAGMLQPGLLGSMPPVWGVDQLTTSLQATHISPAHGAPAAPRLQRVPPPAIYSSAVLAGRPSGAPAAMIRPAPDTYQAVSNVASLQLPTSAAAAAVPLHVHGSIRPVLGAGRGIPPKGAQPPHQQGLQLDAQSSAMYYVHHPMQQGHMVPQAAFLDGGTMTAVPLQPVMAAYPVPRSAAAVEGTVLPGYGGAAPQTPALQHYAAPGPMLVAGSPWLHHSQPMPWSGNYPGGVLMPAVPSKGSASMPM